MRILHVIPSLAAGGAPRGLLEIAERQLVQGNDVQILLFEALDAVADVPCRLHNLDLKLKFSDPVSRRSVIRKATDVIRSIRPEILHSHLLPADYVAAWASRGMAPHVAHIRDTQPWLAAGDISNRIKKWMFRRAFLRGRTHFAAVSAAAAEYAISNLSLPRDRMHVVLNGISFDRFSTNTGNLRSASGFVIGCAGRLSPEKGQVLLLDAFFNVHERMPTSTLRFCGSGSQQSLLRQMAETRGIADAVHFDGQVSDIDRWYRRLDALVVPSLGAEGLPRVIMEAMYCGIPIIAADTAGSRESVIDGVTGFVIPVGNSQAIFRKLEELAGNMDLRRQMGAEASRVAADRFSLERVTREVSALYESLLGSREGDGDCAGWNS